MSGQRWRIGQLRVRHCGELRGVTRKPVVVLAEVASSAAGSSLSAVAAKAKAAAHQKGLM